MPFACLFLRERQAKISYIARYAPNFRLALPKKNPAQLSQVIYIQFLSVICSPDKLTDCGCTGAPDWIIEIVSPGNLCHDFIHKLKLYTDAGVREYWIVDPRQEHIFVYCLEQDKFDMRPYTFQDKIKSSIYDDLCIDFHELDL